MNKLLVMIGLATLAACQRSRTPNPSSTGSTAAAPPKVASAEAPSVRSAPPGRSAVGSFTFDADYPGRPPSGFSFGRTGSGRAGRWLVRADDTAPSAPNVLAQLDDDDTSYRFPIAVTSAAQARDVRVSVRCKMLSGRVDQVCGLVLRYRDEHNYFITRANALEGNIRLYTVRDGKRDQIASHSEAVSANVWHGYRFEAKGDQLRVYWNGKPVIEQRDGTFGNAGAVGLWTKADSVTLFDDLQVEPL